MGKSCIEFDEMVNEYLYWVVDRDNGKEFGSECEFTYTEREAANKQINSKLRGIIKNGWAWKRVK